TQQTEGPGSPASEDQPCPAAPAVAIRVARGDKQGSRRRGPEPGGARQRRPANPMVAKSRYLVARQVAKVEPWLSGNATPLKDRFCQVEVGRACCRRFAVRLRGEAVALVQRHDGLGHVLQLRQNSLADHD